jgi:hypothetical protein
VGGKSSTSQHRSESKQQEPRLVKAETPNDSGRLVASVFFKIVPGSIIQEIHQPRVARLVKIVDHSANQKMNIQLSPKVAQFPAGLAIQNGFANPRCASKTGYDAANRCNFHVAGGVAYEIYLAAA